MSEEKRLKIIAPPGSGGVRDFSDKLSLEFIRRGLKCDVVTVSKSDSSLVVEDVTNSEILIQYSGYGYANRGAPLWLLATLKAERKNIKKIGIFFHELYAFGPPWRSAFWLSPIQRHIARQLVELSDFWMTNREGSAQWLRRFGADKPHAVLPVFSNVGELSRYNPTRMPKIVVFGSAALRLSAYRAAGGALFIWAKKEGLELHDIGPAINDPFMSEALQRAGVVQYGRIELSDVSRQLSDAAFGLVAYSARYVAKSGVFAAYCSHGVCPILISEDSAPADGLVAGIHYLSGLPTRSAPQEIADDVGANAWNWYQAHNAHAHVDALRILQTDAGST